MMPLCPLLSVCVYGCTHLLCHGSRVSPVTCVDSGDMDNVDAVHAIVLWTAIHVTVTLFRLPFRASTHCQKQHYPGCEALG